jgi:NADH dehydrogenase
MKARRILVLGGSGFVGRSACARLVRSGREPRVLTRDLAKARSLQVLPSVEIVRGSPHDPDSLAAALDGVDAVVNLVGILHQSRRQPFEKVHVELPARLVRLMGQAGLRRLVHVSALHAGASGPSLYLQSRGRGEEAIRAAANIDATILKPSVIFGHDDSFLNLFAGLVRPLPLVPLAGASCRFQPVWVEDVARAVDLSLDEPATLGHSYDLCGPRVYTLSEIVRFVAGQLGKRRTIIPLPGPVATLQAMVLERLPGPVMTRDNLRSMQVDSVCGCPFPPVFGFQPAAMEAVVPEYMGRQGPRARYDRFRSR